MECRTGSTANRKGTGVEASCHATVVANSDNEFTQLKYEKEFVQNWLTNLPDTMGKELDTETRT